MRILVIDDDVDIVRLQQIKLRQEGHEVWAASDGTTALDLAAEHRPECVILETELSGTHGHDLIRALHTGTRQPPLTIVLSHQTSDEAIRAGFEAGADDYLLKPFSPRVLSERIRINTLRGR